MAGELHMGITGDASGLVSAVAKSKAALGELNDAAQTAGSGIDDVLDKFKSIAAVAGVSLGAAGVVSFTKKIYEARSAMQDLESTMKVFLGSEEKASKFTKELQDYAYWNMFDFPQLTEASTQLMAYGVATEELIPTIDKLSNVATGTKKPLQDYVNLFNKAKSTGKVDAAGLQSWAAAGIVLKDELKKLGQQVDGNNVSFEQLQMVLNHVTSDGERFGGLMMSQMDNLSASWGQLEDNFANMLNELGEKFQDTFKSGIDFAGVLIDNYEKIGKALFALIAMYGEYKAVLIATAAIQKAQAFMENIKLIGMFRKELGLLKAAQQAFNITAMQNPYVLMAAAIIMTCTAIWGLVSAFKDDRTEVEKLNDTYDERVRALQDEQRQANEHIRTLKDETASTEALRNARAQLADMDAFKDTGISAAQLAYMSPEEIQKKMQEYVAQQEALAKQEKKEGTNARRTQLEKQYVYGMDRDLGVAYGAQQIGRQQAASAKAEILDLDKNEINDYVQELATGNKTLEEQQKILQRNIDRWNGYKQSAEESNKVLEAKTNKTREDYEQMDKNNLLIERAQQATELFSDAVNANTAAIASRDAVEQGMSLPQLIEEIYKAEAAVREATANYAANMNEANKKALENAQNNLKGLTDSYQKATGKQWQDSRKLAEERQKAILAQANEETRIKNAAITDERARRKAEFDQQIKEIKQEEAEYKRAHNGRGSGTLSKKISNATLKYNIDIENLDKQWRDWKANKEKEKMNLVLGIKLDQAKNELENAVTLSDRMTARNKVRKLEDEQTTRANNDARDSELLSKLGGDRDQLAKYQEALKSGADIATTLGIDQETVNQLAEINSQYAELLRLQQQQTEQARQNEDLQTDVSQMQEYVQQTLEIEQERQDRLREIAESAMTQREKDRQIEIANAIAAQKQAQVDKNAGYDAEGDQGQEALARDLIAFGDKLATSTFEQVQEEYRKFMTELDKDIQSLETQNQAIDQLSSVNEQLESGVGANGKQLTEEEKIALQQQAVALSAQLIQLGIEAADVDEVREENAKKLIALKNAQVTAEGTYAAAIERQSQKESDEAVVSRARWNVTKQALASVGSTAREVASTFGDYMSDEAKKALETVSTLVDIAMDSINAVEQFVKGTSEGMQVSSATAAASISALEKASMILTIISAAISLAMAVARLFIGKTAFEKAKEKVDAQVEKVKELKKAQEDLERTYKRSSGTKHYSDMATAAKNYDQIIQEQQKAVRLSEEALDSAKKKEKKEAQQNLEEQQKALQELKDAQYELYQEMQNELLTTNVTSFSETLADKLVEGFEDGTSSIADTWDTVLDDLMKSMMKKQLSLALADLFKGTFDKFNNYVSDGQLTDAEMQTIMNELDAKSKEAEVIAAQYQKMMQEMGILDDANPNADKGGFQSMSQDTADELNARFTALQMEGASVVASTTSILESVLLMQANSDRSVLLIQDIDRFQQLAYEQRQEHIDIARAISESVTKISNDTARLKAIEQNTDRL